MLPNFLLIGAAKAGTTALHSMLAQHPQIFMSQRKEPGFFVFEGTDGHIPMIQDRPFVADLATYAALFEDAGGAKIIGESSPQYLDFASPDVIRRIRDCLPDVRFLVVLRQPVDQAYSRYIMWQRGDRTGGADFRQKFLSDMTTFHSLTYDFYGEEPLVKSYHDRLCLYLDAFAVDRIKIMLYDDFVADPSYFLTEIYRFLDVDPSFHNDLAIRSNPGGLYRSPLIAGIMNRPNPVRWLARRLVPDETRIAVHEFLFRRLLKPMPTLDPALRAALTDLLADEIADLERLIGRDLSAWRKAPRKFQARMPDVPAQLATGHGS